MILTVIIAIIIIIIITLFQADAKTSKQTWSSEIKGCLVLVVTSETIKRNRKRQ